jgi:hypothetical protein
MCKPLVNIADFELPPRSVANAPHSEAAQRLARMCDIAGSAVDYWNGQ